MNLHVLARRLNSIERENNRLIPDQSYFDEFRVTPTCPPSKKLNIRSGVARPSWRWGYIMIESEIPSVICDFEDTTQTNMSCNFANPFYYLPILLCYWGEWVAYRAFYEGTEDEITQVFENRIGIEVRTVEQAESALDSFLNGVGDGYGRLTGWYYYRLPLVALVLKNNGMIGVDGAIEPIDPINRGRSYIYRDIRSRMGISR